MPLISYEEEIQVEVEDKNSSNHFDLFPDSVLENILEFVPDLTEKLSKANLAPRLVCKRWKTAYESAYCVAYNKFRRPEKPPYKLRPLSYIVSDKQLEPDLKDFESLTVYVTPLGGSELNFAFYNDDKRMRIEGKIKTDFPAGEFAKNKSTILNSLQEYISENTAQIIQGQEIEYLLRSQGRILPTTARRGILYGIQDLLELMNHILPPYFSFKLSKRTLRRIEGHALLGKLKESTMANSFFGYLKREEILDKINILMIEDDIQNAIDGVDNTSLTCPLLTKLSKDVILKEKKYLKGISTLTISMNMIRELPKEICELNQLSHLNLRGNELISIPPEIGQLSKLRILNLSGNLLQTLPDEFGQLPHLQHCDLTNNYLSVLPSSIGQLKTLLELRLGDNQLSTIPPEISQLEELTLLELQSNNLQRLPDEIVQLPKIRRIRLEDNDLTELPPHFNEALLGGTTKEQLLAKTKSKKRKTLG